MQAPAAAGGGQKRKISVLPRCVYEHKCYRKSEKHLDEFSHPCPYGGACYRTNEDHRRKRWHPGDGSDDAPSAATKTASHDDDSSSGPVASKKSKKPAAASPPDSPPVSPDPGSGGGGSSTALKGVTICITGTLSMLRKQIVLRILEAGGKWRDNVTGDVQYLVATQNEVVGQTNKVKQAMAKSVPMVTEEFLWDSIKAGKLLDYKKYEIKSDD